MDQPGGARLHLHPADRSPGRGLRRRHLLRDALDRTAAADVHPRVRRHRLHARRWPGAPRRPPRRARGAGSIRRAEPVPRALRAGPRGAGAGAAGERCRLRRGGPGLGGGGRHGGEAGPPGGAGALGPPDRIRPLQLAAAPAHRSGRPGVARLVPGVRRVRGPPSRGRAWPRRGDPGGERRQPHGSWRGRFPHRGEVGSGGAAARASALLRVQRG